MEELGFNDYQVLASKTRKEFDDIKDMQADVGLGLAGEAGEVADIIKKHLAGAKLIDFEHLKEELGDVLWYIAEACDCFGFSMQEVAQKNIEKLKKRHPNGFSGYGIR
ncbi:MAG: nucleoside triphosphate pyrophosphohydrolase family protein [Clostridia bacterium]|nr:nucleoside triphosphate pyrophosphohydrolase family protein [Clostridia bacterium]